MSTTIKIKCIDQTLTYEGTPTVASGGVNEDYIQFEFDSLWDGFAKVAVFYRNKGEMYYGLVSTDNTVVVPKEVTATKGTMYLGVMGVNGDVTRTSQVLQYRIENGALDGFTPVEPTPDVYQQILAELQTIRDLSAETLSNEEAFEKAITEQMATFRTEVDTEIAEKLSKVYRPCGSVANYGSLPKNAEVGDVYNLLDTGVNYAWTGTEWDSLAGIIDVSKFVAKSDIVDNLTTDDSTKVLSARQGKTLKGLVDGKADTSSALQFKGQFKGDFDSTSIPIGIYYLDDVTTTCSNYPYEDYVNGSWGIFVQFDTYQTQMVINTVTVFTRSRTGNPATWNKWHTLVATSAIINNLTSTATNRTLSANQGRILKGLIDTNTSDIASLKDPTWNKYEFTYTQPLGIQDSIGSHDLVFSGTVYTSRLGMYFRIHATTSSDLTFYSGASINGGGMLYMKNVITSFENDEYVAMFANDDSFPSYKTSGVNYTNVCINFKTALFSVGEMRSGSESFAIPYQYEIKNTNSSTVLWSPEIKICFFQPFIKI